MKEESISLHCTEGTADKVYNLQLVGSANSWSVLTQWGRRGSTLSTGNKGIGISYATAKKAYDTKVKEQLGKHYKMTAGAAPGYTAPANDADRDTRYRPQLANEIDEKLVQALLEDDHWLLQEKFDGKRIGIFKSHVGGVYGANRKGLVVGIPEQISNALSKLTGPMEFLLDGEMIGEDYVVFDLLEMDGDLRDTKYMDRLGKAMRFVNYINCMWIKPVVTAYATNDKIALYKELRKRGKEGAIFKLKEAVHRDGRPASGGDVLKLKFWNTATVIVTKINTKRSAAMHMHDAQGPDIPVGNVSVPVNHELPKTGDFIEVKYLYAYRGGSLFQPQYLGVRQDVDASDCSIHQLKYKNEDAEDEGYPNREPEEEPAAGSEDAYKGDLFERNSDKAHNRY